MSLLQQSVNRARSTKFDERFGREDYRGVLVDQHDLVALRAENAALTKKIAIQAKTISSLEDIIRRVTKKSQTEVAVILRPKVDQILNAVCDYYQVSITDLLSRRQLRKISLPRQVAMYLARTMTLHSFPQIGKRMNRDHTTVLHGIEKIATLRLNNAEFDQTITKIERILIPIELSEVGA